MLYDCGGSSLKKPTRCPNCWSEPKAWKITQFRDGKKLYKTGGTRHCELRFDSFLNPCKCDGLVVDEVGYLGPVYDGESGDFYAWEQQTRKWLFKLQSPTPEPSAHVGANWPSTALTSKYIDANLLEHAYIRTLTGDNLPRSENTSTCCRKAYDAHKIHQRVLDEGKGYFVSKAVNDSDILPPGSRGMPSPYYN